MESVSLEDERVIARQLGRPPRGLLRVEHRCPYGYPQVVLTYPLIEGKPFPTIFWLTCPFLCHKIDRLEAAGWIKRMERLIQERERQAERLQAAHRSYVEERLNLLGAKDRGILQKRGVLQSLTETGIGGIADFKWVKCLHLHVAHAMVRENPIGEQILKMAVLPQAFCPPDNIICSAY